MVQGRTLMLAGAALAVVGIALYGFADLRVQEYEDVGGVVSRALESGEQQAYENWMVARTAGAVSAGSGAVLLVTGFLLSRSRP